ncbi:MAG: hypothetical protein JOY79_01225 [Acidobacteriaceae bacterium]|nr:hypothetical protein [Acidobacteriaceae bacterium]
MRNGKRKPPTNAVPAVSSTPIFDPYIAEDRTLDGKPCDAIARDVAARPLDRRYIFKLIASCENAFDGWSEGTIAFDVITLCEEDKQTLRKNADRLSHKICALVTQLVGSEEAGRMFDEGVKQTARSARVMKAVATDINREAHGKKKRS